MFLQIVYYVLFAYWLLLLARLVVELVRTFARDWRPSGIVVVIIEIIFTLTDPPIKLFRRLIPPISLGSVRLDLSLMIVMIIVVIAMQVARSFTPASAMAMALGL